MKDNGVWSSAAWPCVSCSLNVRLPHLPFAAFSLTNTQDWMINMDLWNEYEGRTIDGVFPLTKLLRPEGRSAFFATSNGTGVPTVIRLIESHFDDAEILARWKAISALDNAHLVKMKKFGPASWMGPRWCMR